MPCSSDYLEPTHKEKAFRETAQLCLYMSDKLGLDLPRDIRVEAGKPYAGNVGQVEWLCENLRQCYNQPWFKLDINNANDRKLADWWEKHQAADREREAREAQEKVNVNLRASALAKLTDAERKALRL